MRPDQTSNESRRPPADSVLPTSSLMASAASIEAITPAAAPSTPTVSQVSSAPEGAPESAPEAASAGSPAADARGPFSLSGALPDSSAQARHAVSPGRTVNVTP